MFSLFNRIKYNFLNRFKFSKVLMAMLMLIGIVGGNFWSATYIWNERTPDRMHNWNGQFQYNLIYQQSIWKTWDGDASGWGYHNSEIIPGAGDDLLFSGENPVSVKLTGDTTVNDIIFSYQKGDPYAVTSGSYLITIDLNGYDLTCNNVSFNNDNIPANVKITDSSAGPAKGSFIINGEFNYSDQDHTLAIEGGATININGTYQPPASGNGKITVTSDDDSGTLLIKDGITDPNLIVPDAVVEIPEIKWTGAVNNVWTNPANWTGITSIGQLTNADKVTIPSGLTNYPIAAASATVNLNGDFVIEAGASAEFAGAATFNKITSPDGAIIAASAIIFNDTVSLDTLTLGAAASLTSNGNLTIKNLVNGSPDTSTLKFNQGPGAQSTTIDNMNFGGSEINFGNFATNDTTTDKFTLTNGTLDLSSTSKVTLAGIITVPAFSAPEKMTAAVQARLVAPVTLAKDLTIDGAVIAFNGTVSGSQKLTTDCTSVYFRGDVTIDSLTVNKEAQFLGTTDYITTTGTQTYNGNIVTNRDISLIAGTSEISIAGTLNSWDASHRKITVGDASNSTSLKINKAIGNAKAIGDITVNGNFTTASNITADSISVTGTSTFGTSTITTTGAQSYTGAVTLKENATFTAGLNTVTFGSTVDCNTTSKILTIGGTAAANKTNVIFTGKVGSTKPLLTLTHYGDVTLNDDVTLSNWNNVNDSTITPGTSTVYINDAGTISGSNTFYNLTIDGTAAGKTISFGAGKTQTVNGKFTVTGTAGNEITLKSSTDGTQWTIDTPVATADVKYAVVKDSNSSNDSIKTSLSKSLGNNINWIIAGNYRWTGSTSSQWENNSNWQVEIGTNNWVTATEYPGEKSKEDTVSVITTTGTNWPNYKLSSAITLNSISIGDSTHTNAVVNIGNTGNIILTKASAPITNYGTVWFSSTGRFIDTTTPTAKYLMDTTRGTVEYTNDATTITNFGSGGTDDYYNLVIKNSAALDSGHQIIVRNKLTIDSNGTAEITGGQSIYVYGESSLGGNITTAHNQEYNGAVTFTKAAITLSATAVDGASNPYRVIFDNTITGITAGTALEFEHATFKTATTFTNIKTLTVNGTTINSGTITTSGAQTYTGLVTNSGTINVPSLATGTTAIAFKGGYNGTGGTLIGSTTTNPDILFAGGSEVTFGTLTQNSDVIKFTNSSAMDFTPGSSTYNDILFNGTGTVTLKGDLNAANLTLNSGSSLAGGSYTITLSKNWNNAGGTFTPGTSTVELSPSGTTASVSGDTTFYNLTCTSSGKTLEFQAGKTQTVNNKFTVTGSTGTGNQIALKSSTAGTQWTLTVTAADKVAVSNATLIDSNSTFEKVTAASSLSLGNNTNWDIAQNFVWKTAAASTDWKDPANWQVTFNASSTDAHDYPGQLSDSDTVTVPAAATNNPVFAGGASASTSITLLSLNLSQANSKLTLSTAADIKLSDTTPLSNTGTIIYSDTGRIKNNAATPAPIMDTAKGTVQFDAGASSITEIGTADYFNLVVNGTGHTLGGAIAVGGTFTLSDNGTITSGTSLSVTGTSSIGGDITTTGDQTYSQKATLTQDSQLIAGTNKVTLSKGAESKDAADKKSLTIGNATNKTQLDTGAALSNLNDLTVWGYFQANSGAITCDGDITFKSDTIFRGAVTGKTLTVDGKTTVGYITATIKTTNGDQTFNDIVYVNTDTTHKETVFLAGTNTVYFNKGISAYLNVASGAVSDPIVTIGSDTAKTNVSIDHDAGIDHNAGTAARPLTSLTVYGTTTLGANTNNILTTGPQTYTDAVTFAADLTLNSTGNDTITVSNNFTSTPVKNVTIENGKFSQLTGTFTANDLTVKNSSTFNFGTGAFTAGTLTVNPGASFTQTGDNTTNTQKVTGLVNNGTMVWDSASQGGTLTIGTGGITDSETDATLVVFNNKNLTIDASSISGIFYNLTIPASKTITNRYKIVVRNNFTINGTYTHNNKPLVLGTFKITNAPNPDIIYTTGPAGAANNIITSADNSVTQNLGTVTINQGAQSKDIKFPVNFTTLTCDDTTTGAGEIKFEKALTVTNAATLTTKGTLSFATTSTDESAVTTEFADGVSVTQAAKVNIGGTFKTASGTISISSPVELTAKSVIQTTGTDITFTKSITNASGKNAELTITSNPLGTDTTGDITLGGNITVKKLTLENPNLLTFTASSISAKDGFTLNGNGNTKIGTSGTAVTISTTDSNILFDTPTGTVTLLSDLKLDTNTGNGDITLNKNFTGSTTATEKLTLTSGTGSITLNSNLGTTALHLGDTTFSGNNITVPALKEIYASKVSVTNTGLLHLTEGTKITADNGFTKTGTGLSQIATTITTSDSPVAFSSSTYIDGTTTINAGTKNITIGTTVSDDLYISAITAAAPKDVKFTAGTLDVKGNIALFNGNISLNANMTAGKDIILLNGTAATMYNDSGDNTKSGITGLYDYHNPARKIENKLCPPSLVFTDPATGTVTASKYPEKMPDTVTVTLIDHTSYNSSISGYQGKTISAKQNFYDNGVNLDSESSSWNLAIKTNDSAVDGFAELYNAGIQYCNVQCTEAAKYAWVSAAENCTDLGNNNNDTDAIINYSDDSGIPDRSLTGIAFLRPALLENNPAISAAEGRKTAPEVPNLSGTYSVRDNVIRIEFVRNNDSTKNALIENSNNEISRAMSHAVKTIKVNGGTALFEDAKAYIDAECTTSTDGKGDIAVFYIKADSIRWNLKANGTDPGAASEVDSQGVHQTATTDLTIEKALADVFYTLTDEHKNRISSYKAAPISTPSAVEGYIFTATETRCAIAEMHITFAVADFTSNKIYLYFDNPLSDKITWQTFKPETPNDKKTESAVRVITGPGDTTSVNPVQSVSRDGISENGIILILQNDLDYSMIEYGIVIKYGGTFLFDNKIHSPDNKVVVDGESHCISDVITDCVDVQYAYDNRNDAYIDSTNGLAPADSIATRDFTGEGIHNRVFADKNITLVTKDISKDNNPNAAPAFKYKLIADINPSANSSGILYPAYSGHQTRLWFPEGTNAVSGFAPALNLSTSRRNSVDNSDLITQTVDSSSGITTYYFHNFSEEQPCLNWNSGSDVRFLFEALKADGTQYTINHKYDVAQTEVTPLYVARLKNPGDISTIDLWSFKIQEPQRQRGGVSVYSNVVNATAKEFCTVEVNMPSAGSLRVIVMTADGNVVKYLENGRQTEGLHYYYWNGTNNAGNAVARGIYFIRVVGPDIEETRKVMVVK